MKAIAEIGKRLIRQLKRGKKALLCNAFEGTKEEDVWINWTVKQRNCFQITPINNVHTKTLQS